MSAPIAFLVVILFTLAASLSAQVSKTWPNYSSEQNDNSAQVDENASDDKSEQKHNAEQTDKRPLKKVSKKRDNVCVKNCPDVWRPYQLTPWPIVQQATI